MCTYITQSVIQSLKDILIASALAIVRGTAINIQVQVWEYLFPILLSGHIVILHLTFWRIIKLCSQPRKHFISAPAIYSHYSTSLPTRYFPFFFKLQSSSGYKVAASSLWFWFTFPWRLKILYIFMCFSAIFISPLGK